MATGVGKGRALAALFLLSLLWALDGLGPDLLPGLRQSKMPAMERQSITYALFAVVAAAYARKRQARLLGTRSAVAWLGIGLLLFVIPATFAAAAQGWVSQLERVAIFSLTPVFAVVLEPHLGNMPQPGTSSLVAAMVAVAGALCIFPLDLPGTPGAAIAVLAIVLAAACAATGNCLAVRIASSSVDGSLVIGAALASGSAAVEFALASVITEHAQWQFVPKAAQLAWLAFIDVPALMLLFWLLPRMAAARMTVRFILAPLLAILTGIALEQPAITTRMILGIVLISAGVLWLLLTPGEDIDRVPIGIL